MDPAEPEQPGRSGDDGPGSPPSEAPGPPGDEAPGPLQNETPGPGPDEAAGPSGDAANPSGNAAAPSGAAAGPSEDKALGPLQYGDASSPLHKATHEEPSAEPEKPSRELEEPSPEHEEPSQKQPVGTIPAAATADATAAGAEIPASRRRSRRRKVLAWTSGVLAAVVVIGVLGAYFVYRHLNGNLHQVDISGVLGSQPVDLHPQAENILILGSDTRTGQGGG